MKRPNKKIWHELSFNTPQYNIQVWCRKNSEIPNKISFVLLENAVPIFNAWMIRSGKYKFQYDKTQMNFEYASMLFRYCVEYAVKNMEMVVR